jgi:arylsulfatase A-like enzyme
LTQEYGHVKHYYKALGMDHLDLPDDKYGSMWFYDDYATEMEKRGLLTAYRDRFFNANTPPETFPEFPHAKEIHPDSWVGQKALEHLDRCAPGQPHFMWVSFAAPHYPMDAPADYFNRVNMDKDIPRHWREGEWDDATKACRNGWFGTGASTEGSAVARDGAQKNFSGAYWREWRKRYYANIVQVDDYMGAIIAKARAIWGDDLCVVFTSDHGDMMGNHGLWGKNTALYDDVLRVPLVVHHPGQQTRRDVFTPVSSVDVFPTLLAMAGCEPPAGIDGMPLSKIEAQGGREIIFSSCEGRVAVIKGGLKLCVNAAGFEYFPGSAVYRELYDLEKDPFEFENVYNAPAYRKERNELEAILRDEPGLLRTIFYPRDGSQPYWFRGAETAQAT